MKLQDTLDIILKQKYLLLNMFDVILKKMDGVVVIEYYVVCIILLKRDGF